MKSDSINYTEKPESWQGAIKDRIASHIRSANEMQSVMLQSAQTGNDVANDIKKQLDSLLAIDGAEQYASQIKSLKKDLIKYRVSQVKSLNQSDAINVEPDTQVKDLKNHHETYVYGDYQRELKLLNNKISDLEAFIESGDTNSINSESLRSELEFKINSEGDAKEYAEYHLDSAKMDLDRLYSRINNRVNQRHSTIDERVQGVMNEDSETEPETWKAKLINILKAHGVSISEIHSWADGDYKKTPEGWRKIKQDAKKHLDKLNEKTVIADEKGESHRMIAFNLNKRIDELKSIIKKRPDVQYFHDELKKAQKELIHHTVKQESAGRYARSRVDQYIEQLTEYLKDHAESYIRGKHLNRLDKLQEKRDALDEGGSEYNRIMDEHLSMVGKEYEHEEEAKDSAEAEIETEAETLDDEIQEIEDWLEEMVSNEHDKIDDRISDLNYKSYDDVSDLLDNESELLQDLKFRYKDLGNVGNLSDPYEPLDDIKKRVRQNLSRRKKIADRIKLKPNRLNLKSRFPYYLNILKAFGQRHGLQKKVITNKRGKKQTVWIRPREEKKRHRSRQWLDEEDRQAREVNTSHALKNHMRKKRNDARKRGEDPRAVQAPKNFQMLRKETAKERETRWQNKIKSQRDHFAKTSSEPFFMSETPVGTIVEGYQAETMNPGYVGRLGQIVAANPDTGEVKVKFSNGSIETVDQGDIRLPQDKQVEHYDPEKNKPIVDKIMHMKETLQDLQGDDYDHVESLIHDIARLSENRNDYSTSSFLSSVVAGQSRELQSESAVMDKLEYTLEGFKENGSSSKGVQDNIETLVDKMIEDIPEFRFIKNLNKSSLPYLDILKAFGQRHGLVKKVITNKKGKKQTVWIKPEEAEKQKRPGSHELPGKDRKAKVKSPVQRPTTGTLNPEPKTNKLASPDAKIQSVRNAVKPIRAAKPTLSLGAVQDKHAEFEKEAREQRRLRGINAPVETAGPGDIIQVTKDNPRVKNQIGRVLERLENGIKVMMPTGIFQEFSWNEVQFAKSSSIAESLQASALQILKARNTSHLVRKVITNKLGRRQTVLVNPDKDNSTDTSKNQAHKIKDPIVGEMDKTPTSAQIKRMVERLEQWYEHLDEKLQDDDSGEYAQKLQKKYGDDNPKEIVREYLTNDLYSKYDFVLNFREDLSEFGTQSPSNYDELVKKYDLARDRLDEMIQSRVEKEEDDFVTEAIDFLTNDRSLLYVTAKEDLAKKNEGYEEALQEIQAEQENILYKIGKAVEGITEVFRDSGLDVSTHFATTTNSVYITLENEDREEVRIRVADHQMAADMGGKTEPDYSIEFDFVPVPLGMDSKLNHHSTGDDDIEGTIMAAASDLGVDIDPEQAKKIHNVVHDSKGRLTSDEFLDQKFSNLRAREDYF